MPEDKELNDDIEKAIERFRESMDALNITLTEDEINDKRRELQRATGAELDIVEPGGIETWEEVAGLLQSSPGSVSVIDDFQKLDDKSLLINVPFYINRFWFTEGEMGDFAVAHCVTSTPVNTSTGMTSKIILTDGSTGIFKQLREYAKKTGKSGQVIIRHGLRVSQYTADTDQGPKAAETFYLT